MKTGRLEAFSDGVLAIIVKPHYNMLWKESIPVVEGKDENGKLTVIDIMTMEEKK